MIDQTLKDLEQKIKKSPSIPDSKKQELLGLLSELRSEVVNLAETKGEEAESIAGFTKLSGYEATREKKNRDLLDLSLQGLVSSVEEFEVSHPKLVATVNSVCTMLANMGI